MYHTIPINCISAEGWLQEYLLRQREGITGHIEKCGKPFYTEKCLWEQDAEGFRWPAYEQWAYWVDGALKCAYIINDEELLSRMIRIIDVAIEQAQEDGYIGPLSLKGNEDSIKDTYIRWPHVVFFRALIAQAEATGSEKIIQALVKHYKENRYDSHFGRNVCNIEILVWLYEKTKDTELRDMAVNMYQEFLKDCKWKSVTMEHILSEEPFDLHGVTVCEILKLLPLLYRITGEQSYLDACIHAVEKLKRDHLLIDGVIDSEEFTVSNSATNAHETCDIADWAWLLGYLFQVTGNTEYLDIIEKATLNAAPAVVMPDFKSLQYFSSPNLVIAAENSTPCRYTKGMWTMSYRPYGYAQCCTGNVNRIMPNYAYKLWHVADNGTLAATLYAPSQIEYDGLTIVEETSYPFDLGINFKIEADIPKRKKISFRIPGWAKSYSVVLNGSIFSTENNKGFIILDRVWNNGDVVSITFEAVAEIKESPDDGRYLQYGPMVFAFAIPYSAEIVDVGSRCEYPCYSLKPTGEWNYALRTDLIGDLKPVYCDTSYPWETYPMYFELPVEKIEGWKLIETDRVERWIYKAHNALIDDEFVYSDVEGQFALTPPLPDNKMMEKGRSNKVEWIRVIPYGCTKLRISVFPSLG